MVQKNVLKKKRNMCRKRSRDVGDMMTNKSPPAQEGWSDTRLTIFQPPDQRRVRYPGMCMHEHNSATERESERRRQRQPGFKALRSPAKRESKSSHVARPTPHMQRLARAYHAATAYLNPGHALVGFDLRPSHQLHNLNIGRHKIQQAGRVLLYCGATLSCRPIDPLAHRHLNAARGIAADGDVEEHNRERHGGC